MAEEIKLILDNKDLSNDQKTQILIELFKSKQLTTPYYYPTYPAYEFKLLGTEIKCGHELK